MFNLLKKLKSLENMKRYDLNYSQECINEYDNGDYLDRDEVLNFIDEIIKSLELIEKDIPKDKKDRVVNIIKSNTGVYNIFITDKNDFHMLFFNEGKKFDTFSKEMSHELIRIKYEEDNKL